MPTLAPKNGSSHSPTPYTLYFSDTSADSLQPMKRLRFASVPDAVDRALEMKRGGTLKPVEVRDDQGRLITCELIGWRFSPLTPRTPAASGRADIQWRSPV